MRICFSGMSTTPYDNDTPMHFLRSSLKTKGTRRQYAKILERFFGFINLKGTLDDQTQEFITQAKKNPEWARQGIIKFLILQNDRVERGEISPSTVQNYYKPIKALCALYDIPLSSKIISRFIPDGPNVADDRAPQLDEIQRLLKDSDPRIKPMVLVMTSSGISVEAWEYLKFGHIEPQTQDGQIVAAKMIVNVGKKITKKRHRYITFITPEAWNALEEWKNFRKSWGEDVTDDSWVIRDRIPTTDIKRGIRGLGTVPKKLKYDSIEKLLTRAMYRQGLRQPLSDGVRRHLCKLSHGFRKWYKTRAEGGGMKTLYVETLIGHHTGLSAHYFRPGDLQEDIPSVLQDKSQKEKEMILLEDYLKAVPNLTIEGPPSSAPELQQIKEEQAKKDEQMQLLIKEHESSKQTISELETKLIDIHRAADVYTKEQESKDKEIEFLKEQMEGIFRVLEKVKINNGIVGDMTMLDEKRRVTIHHVGHNNKIMKVKIPIDDIEVSSSIS